MKTLNLYQVDAFTDRQD